MSCKGCRTYRTVNSGYVMDKCIIKNNAPKKSCPCELCIVKTTCNRTCNDFDRAARSIFKMKLWYDYKNIEPMGNVERVGIESYYTPVNQRPLYKRKF